MAQSSDFTPVVVYHSETEDQIPSAVNLAVGELALNIFDRKLYTKNTANEIVEITNGGEHTHTLSEISDLDLSGVSDGDTLIYDADTTSWVVGSTGGTITVTDISDVDTTGVTDGDSLVYDGDTSTWVAGEATGGGAGGGSAGTPHRYWRLETDGSTFFNGINLYAYGEAFAGNKRWEEGTLVNSLATLTADQSTTGASQTTASLLDGIATDRGAPFNNERANYATSPTFDIDFGAEPQVLNNVHIAMSQGNLSSLTLSYSDDDVTYTEVGTISTIPAQTTEAFSVPFVFLEQVETVANDALENFPDPNSGGGALWTYNYALQSSNFTATAGVYYINVQQGIQITLPASPSQGDFVGIKVNPGGSVTINATSFGPIVVINGESSSGFSFANQFSISSSNGAVLDDTYPEYAGLVYVDATQGWSVIFGEVWVTSA